MVEILEIIGLGGLFLTFFGFMTKIYLSQGKLQERVARLEGVPPPPDLTGIRDRLAKLESCYDNLEGIDNKVGALETKMDLFWGALEEKLPSLLLRGNPIPLESPLGVMLKKLKENNITDPERRKLISMLDEEALSGHYDPGEKMVLVLLGATLFSSMCAALKAKKEGRSCGDRSP